MPYGQPWMQAGREVAIESTLDIEVDPTLAAGSISATELGTNAVETVKIKDGAVSKAKLNADIAGSGITGGAGTAISVNVDDASIEINGGNLRLKDGGIQQSKLQSGIIGNNQLMPSVLQYAQVQLTAAQVKALATSPFELVAAQGAGNTIVFVSAALMLVAGTEVLAEAGDNLGIKYTDASGLQLSEDIETTGFIDQATGTTMLTNAICKKDLIVNATGADNQALVLDNLGNDFTGNASDDAVMNITVWYRVLVAPGP